jgi:UDP-glucose 4-epimerase
MKIMITGGLGFIGSHLAQELDKEGHQIIILTKSLTKKNNLPKLTNIRIQKIDVTNFKKFGASIDTHKPQLIIHLAGQTSHSKSFENPLMDVDSNSKSTLFILEKIRKMKNPSSFILGSTFIVIGKPKKLPVNEETTCNPSTIYGTNRLSSEFFCKIYHNLYGLDTKIFRITNSFGPREQIIPNKNAVNYLIHQAYKGEKITIFNEGNFFRDIIYISDVISGINTIIKKGKSGELYWISSSKKTWFYKFGTALENFSSSKVKFVKTPKYTKKVDVGNFVVSNNKLKSLGWIPKVSMNEGIKKTLEYFDSLNKK